MKLQEQLTALKNEKLANLPPELTEPLLKEMEILVQSGIADKAIKVGDTLPGFTLPDERGNLVNSKALLSKGPLVISFYRGVW